MLTRHDDFPTDLGVDHLLLILRSCTVVTREVEEKNRASLPFYAMTEDSIKAAWEDKGCYSNKEKVRWGGARPLISVTIPQS